MADAQRHGSGDQFQTNTGKGNGHENFRTGIGTTESWDCSML